MIFSSILSPSIFHKNFPKDDSDFQLLNSSNNITPNDILNPFNYNLLSSSDEEDFSFKGNNPIKSHLDNELLDVEKPALLADLQNDNIDNEEDIYSNKREFDNYKFAPNFDALDSNLDNNPQSINNLGCALAVNNLEDTNLNINNGSNNVYQSFLTPIQDDNNHHLPIQQYKGDEPTNNNETSCFLHSTNSHTNTKKRTKTSNKKVGDQRKNKPDCIRKKIKSRLHKRMMKVMNEKLKKVKSLMIFESLPQPFIKNINIKFNKHYMNYPLKELYKLSFNIQAKDKEKTDTNKRVLNYLNDNPNILSSSGIGSLLEMTYENFLEMYFNGEHFLRDIEELRERGTEDEYLCKYKYIGKHWVQFFMQDGKLQNEKFIV